MCVVVCLCVVLCMCVSDCHWPICSKLDTACNGADKLFPAQPAFHTICTDIHFAFIMHIHTNILCQ